MKKFFAMLSIIFFSITLIMMMSLYQAKTVAFVDYLFDISVFTPIFFNVLGIVSACFSPKGTTRKTLIFINGLMMIYFAIFIWIGIYGFQEP
ncbi:hypothetical protein M3210_19320 [Oceanobacillus luteolus]|uniref:Uncharacterized protein n=1 Tax=Oceanobacillus luteolus TaxID=1274358 RepID=A0ABW4HNG9_9BACI|nr:hypothetical protein [Oceanobacillus luteolus]MCM3742368.1 hypothetical protein [Oceanobacillus luteolus]